MPQNSVAMTAASGRFHPVVLLPVDAVVADFSGTAIPTYETPWVIGRYDEARPAMYTQDLFGGAAQARCLHVGVDLGGPVGTAVHAFADGRVLHRGYNAADGDYGHVIVTEHPGFFSDGQPVYALHGHLSAASVTLWTPGDAVARGQVLGWLGAHAENGGWPPHVHFQLSRERPETHDMPGAVAASEREAALHRYPDPRQVLGPIY